MEGGACETRHLDLPLGLHHDEADVAALAHRQDLAHVAEILQCHGLRRASHLFDVDLLLDTQGFVYMFI